jgi:hypothetical protein
MNLTNENKRLREDDEPLTSPNNFDTTASSISLNSNSSLRVNKNSNIVFTCTSDEIKTHINQKIDSYENLEQLKIADTALSLLNKIPTYKGI